MKQELHGAVVVITGASSGIGRVTAKQFAEQGAKVVLAARDGKALDDVAMLCERRGGIALPVLTDMRDEAQVNHLRQVAVSRFGRIDVWVNAAASYMMGPFERVPAEQFRVLLEINVMSVVHGCQAALEQFRAQGRGTLITVGSVAGKAAYAQASAYCASKHAIHALHETLRQELSGTRIKACLVTPATVDTPLFQHAANYTGRQLRAMPPVQSPERVAAAIVACARSPRREVVVGTSARIMGLLGRFMPSMLERFSPTIVSHEHLGTRGAGDTVGNFERPMPPHADAGGWRRRSPMRPN
jgi:NADP-dependent 3-hydroxy acid dehydrogenase YdfG